MTTLPLRLQGLGQPMARVFSIEIKPTDEALETIINTALAEEIERIKPSREDIDTFSWITKDNNPIHRLPKIAQRYGFNDVPLMGAHVAALGEQYIERVVQHMREYWGADIKIIGQKNQFRAPLHPEERVLWQVEGYKQKNGAIELEVSGAVKDKQVVTITSRLGNLYPLMPQIAGPIYSKRFLLTPEHLEAFYKCVGGKGEKVPNMLPAAFVPATLLNLLEDKTQTMEGMNLLMDFDFLSQTSPGHLQVDIFRPKKPLETRGSFVYKFKTVVSQDNIPRTYGEIVSSTPYKIEFN